MDVKFWILTKNGQLQVEVDSEKYKSKPNNM